MPKSRPNVKLKIEGRKKKVEIEAIAVHGHFVVHNDIKRDLSINDRYFNISHIPSGFAVVRLCPFKSKAIELAKLLNELVLLGVISSGVHQTKPNLVKAAFSTKATMFLIDVDALFITTSKARELTFQELFERMFRSELKSRPKLEQQSLFGWGKTHDTGKKRRKKTRDRKSNRNN